MGAKEQVVWSDVLAAVDAVAAAQEAYRHGEVQEAAVRQALAALDRVRRAYQATLGGA